MRKSVLILFFVVASVLSFCMSSCSCRSREEAFVEPLKADSLYYAKGLKIAYYQDYITVEIADPWDSTKVRARYVLIEREELQESSNHSSVIADEAQKQDDKLQSAESTGQKQDDKSQSAESTSKKQEDKSQLAESTSKKQDDKSQSAESTGQKQEDKSQSAESTSQKQDDKSQLAESTGQKKAVKIHGDKTQSQEVSNQAGRQFSKKSLPEGTLLIIPLRRVVSYTSVHASMLEQLGALDAVVGVCEPQYLTSNEIKRRVESGQVADLGEATSPNLEKIIDLQCDAIIASPYENSGYGAAEKLGVPIIEAADYMENHPLGRAEWVRLFGLLVGKREEADSLFFATMSRYNILKEKALSVEHKPKVLLEKKYGSAWQLPSGNSYIATMHRDAGAEYLFKDYHGAENKAVSVEAVLENASEADFWLMKVGNSHNYTYSDLSQESPLYQHFKAFKERSIYICSTINTPYYDDITIHPDWILEDFIHIYHPELLPGYHPRYYFNLSE